MRESGVPSPSIEVVSSASTFTSAKPPSSALSTTMGLKQTQRMVATPEARDRALLVRMDSASAGQVWHVANDSPFGCGRHPDNGGCLDDEGISRFHCRLSKSAQGFIVEDLGSSNGTYVNGKRVEVSEIRNGDTLQLGPRVSFRFSIASEHEERVLRQLYESSVRDPLTRAFNRQYFSNRIKSEIAFAVRHRTHLALALLDIDFFKKTNDTYGHLAGDAVLKAVTQNLGRALRTEDILARYGGEEFVVLLRGIPLDKADRAAERLREAVARAPVVYEGRTIPVTISLGVATLSCCNTANPDDLVGTADRRLYAAKESGRNRVVSTG